MVRYHICFWFSNPVGVGVVCPFHRFRPTTAFGRDEELICQVIEVLEEAGVRGRVKIAFDEWNLRGWHHPGFPRKEPVKPDDSEAAELIKRRELNAVASQYSMADALFSASFLNACLRHADDVGMANIAPIVNTRGPIYVHPKGIVRRTTYHTLALYARKLEERVGKLTVECGPLWGGNRMADMVDAVATVDESGTVVGITSDADRAAIGVRISNGAVSHRRWVIGGVGLSDLLVRFVMRPANRRCPTRCHTP